MPDQIYNLYDAKTRISELVDRAASGEEIIIAKNGKPMAKLGPYPKRTHRREPGAWAGRVRISEDFDAPLSDEVIRDFEGG